ncbi:hypothetical protein HHI36_005943 [Cryptolaemus montrouzieri]|uniref:Uncharacterized protein n=1 Tax=Cryptolaemus montrouzieri TaxID=559131 RepID=A0ABD2NWS0_9CUCU
MNLFNKIVNVDLQYKDFEDLRFLTTAPKCAQGFKAIFEYFPCREISTEIPPPRPITKIWPVPPPTTIRPSQKCGRIITEEFFTLANEENSSECHFIIEKLSKDVCELVLNFEQFHLDCNLEDLTINGRSFCRINRKTVVIPVQDAPTEISYRSKTAETGIRFVIKGFQNFRNCEVPLPPAQLY